MPGRRRRIFHSRRSTERRLAVAVLILAAVGWIGIGLMHPTPDVPGCASDPAKREVVRSLAETAPRTASDISLKRYQEKDDGDGRPDLKPGAPRHCAAVAEFGGRQRLVRYNIEPLEEPPGYRVAVFEHRTPETRR